MMNKRCVAAAFVVAVAVFGEPAQASASATPPLACYKAQMDEFGKTGNYKNATCTEKTAVLKGEYVLAEPLFLMEDELWCAKLTPVVGPPGTGLYENATCTKKQEDGEFTVIITPVPPPLACYKAQMDEFGETGNYKNATCTEKTAVLKGEYVLAEPMLFLKEKLWCAKLTPAVGPPGTGVYENATCAKKKENGEFTEVIVSGPGPNILPEATAAGPLTGTSKSSVTSTFGNGILELASPKSKGEQEDNTPKSGLFVTHFEETESVTAGTKCTGLHDATEGTVTVLGTYHVRDFKENNTLLTALIFSLLPVHFTCGTAVPVLVVTSGCVAGALTPENILTKTLTVTLIANSTGKDNLIITVLNEANTAEESCQLLAKEGSGATKLAKEVTTQELSGFKQSGATVEVLVMRL